MNIRPATLFLRSCMAAVAGSALVLSSVSAAHAATTAGEPSATAGQAASKAVTIGFSDANAVYSASDLQTQLANQKGADCTGKAESAHVSVAHAISQARTIEDKGGRSKVAKVDSSRDTKPADAELDATSAEASGDPVGALAALLAAYGKNARSRVVLDGLGAVMGQIGEPADAIALIDKATSLGGTLQHPMGISEQATELNDRGYALLQLHQWAGAATALTQAVSKAPMMDAAKLNLAEALTCQGKLAQAAKMLVAGALPGDHSTVDETGGYTEIPPDQIMDTSLGKAGAWPPFTYPESASGILQDGSSFEQFNQDALNAELADYKSFAAYDAALSKLPLISRERIGALVSDAANSNLGGWAADLNRAEAAGTTASTFWSSVLGEGGTAQAEVAALQATGEPVCTLQPKFQQWMTQQTGTFHTDMVAWDDDLQVWWKAESKWASGILANIKDPTIAKDVADFADYDKQLYIYSLTQIAWYWDQDAQLDLGYFSGSSCEETTGPDENPPTDPKQTLAGCPDTLKRASFSISLQILKIAVNCEKVSITVQSGAIGPFGKVSVSYNGDMTITVGAKAGVSLGPASAGVDAGMYVHVTNGEVCDVGFTANASASVSAGQISFQTASANATVGLEDVTSAMYNLVQ